VLLWGSRERSEESVLYNPKGEPRQGGAVIGGTVGAPLSLLAVSHGTVYIDIAAIVVLGIETATVRCASRSQYLLSVLSGAASSVCFGQRQLPLPAQNDSPPQRRNSTIARACLSVDAGLCSLGSGSSQAGCRGSGTNTFVHACPGGAGYSLKQRAYSREQRGTGSWEL
jgi:hypothetical protein